MIAHIQALSGQQLRKALVFLSIFMVMGSCQAVTGSVKSASVLDVGYLETLNATEKDRYANGLRQALFSQADNILNFKALDVALLFDRPDLERRDGTTVVWQYRTPACVLDLYMTGQPNAEPYDSPIEHYEIRLWSGNGDADQEMAQVKCVRNILSVRRNPAKTI